MLWKSVWNIHDYSWNYGFESPVWKFSSEQAGHTIRSAVPLWILGSEPSLLQGGRGSGRCQESGVLRTSLEMECGTVSRKEGWAGGWASISYEVRNRQLELKDIGREQEYLVADTRILFSQTCQCLREFAQVQVSQTPCASCPAIPPLCRFSDPSLGLLLRGS